MQNTIKFGVHLLFDGYGCNPEKLADQEHLTKLLKELPVKMGMHTISPEIVIEVGEQNEKDPGGISGFVMFAESHISFHTFPKRRFVTADFYTCQDTLDSDSLVEYLAQAFDTNDFDTQIIDRGTRYPSENVG